MTDFEKPPDHVTRYTALKDELITRGLTTKKAFTDVWAAHRKLANAVRRLSRDSHTPVDVTDLADCFSALGDRMILAHAVAVGGEGELIFEGMVLGLELVDRLDVIETTEPPLRNHLEKATLLIEARRLLK